MAKDLARLLTTIALFLLLLSAPKTDGKVKLKKLIKAGLVLGALGSKKLPSIVPIPLPVPFNLDRTYSFGGGHFGNHYHHYQTDYMPAHGHGGYAYGTGYGGQGYGGGGHHAPHGGWW